MERLHLYSFSVVLTQNVDSALLCNARHKGRN